MTHQAFVPIFGREAQALPTGTMPAAGGSPSLDYRAAQQILLNEVGQLEHQREMASRAVAALRQEHEARQAEVLRLSSVHSSLSAEVTELANRREAEMAQYREVSTRRAADEARLQKIEQELAMMGTRSMQAAMSTEAQEERLKELVGQLEGMRAATFEAEAKRRVALDAQAVVEERLRALTVRQEESTRAELEARASFDRLEAQRQETERRLERLREDTARLDAESAQVRRQITADETRAAGWREEIVKVSADRLQCLARHAEIQQELQKLTETQHQSRMLCDEFETKRTRLDAEVNDLASEQARRTSALAEIDAIVQRLRAERDELDNAIRQAVDARAKAEKQRENALAALQDDLPRLARVQSELVSTERDLGTMSLELERVRSDLESLQQEESETCDRLATARLEMLSTEKTISALRAGH
ncbi:MAG: hypothetical protein JNG86_11470, partial [Verrucomicrobiaceae bacterium]|nr:hypothetical protein [Verrucomicrobiaceae bacterium]